MEADDRLSEIVEPLNVLYVELDTKVVELQEDMKAAREERDRILRVLRLLDPERFSTPRREEKKKGPSEATLSTVRDFLRTTSGLKNNFTASQLKREYEGLPSAGTLGLAFSVMHENGELALVGSAQGGAKVYRIIR